MMPDQIDQQIEQLLQGGSASAPAGYSPDEDINRLLGPPGPTPSPATPPPPATSPLPGYARWPLGLASAGASGLAYGLGLPGDIERLGVRYLANPLARLTGIGHEDPTDQAHLFFPTSETMQEVAQAAGLTGHPSLAPQSSAERIAQAGAAGLGSMVPLMLTGQPPLPMAATGAAGGVAGQSAAELGAPPVLQIGAGLVGGLAAGGAAQAAIRALSRGVPHIAADLGESSTLQTAGNELQINARNWVKGLPDRLKSIWSPVDSAIPSDTQVPLDNFTTALNGITSSAGSLAPLEKLLRPALPERLKDALTGGAVEAKMPPAAAPPRVSTASAPGGGRVMNPPQLQAQIPSSTRFINAPGAPGTGPQSWEDVAKLRSAIGDAMSNPKIINDIGADNLSRLYASIASDMKTAAAGVSPEAGAAFDAANAESTRLYKIAEGPMSDIVYGPRPNVAEDPRPEDVAQRLLSGGKRGASDLQILRQEIPQGVDELAAAHLRLNPDARAWSDAAPPSARLAPEAREALVPSAEDRARLADIGASSVGAKKSALAKIGEHTLGLWLGGAAGAAISPFLPIAVNPYVAAGVGELTGAVAPYIWHGVRGALRNPIGLGAGGIGAAANPSLGVVQKP